MCIENCLGFVVLNVRVFGEYKMVLLVEIVEWGFYGMV